jgi:hypothetical protein
MEFHPDAIGMEQALVVSFLRLSIGTEPRRLELPSFSTYRRVRSLDRINCVFSNHIDERCDARGVNIQLCRFSLPYGTSG